MVSIDGGSTWIYDDKVRCSCLLCNFTVEVVCQYYKTVLGATQRYTPDYSTPYARLNGVINAYKSCEKYKWFMEKVTGAPPSEDRWWHEQDAVLGHGFVCFQYEGPDLGTELNTKCKASAYRHKWFWGKTGGGGLTQTFWDYVSGNPNDQNDIAWWDICDSKTDDDKRLVLRRTYTLNYNRINDLFDTFADYHPTAFDRYDNFGLHINLANKGWGCLSNVGLGMEDHDIDNASMANSRLTKNLPTTANKSVWRVAIGTRASQDANVVEAVFNAIKNHCSGVDWDASVATTGAGSLGEDLLDILQGKTIKDENSLNWDIATESDLHLNTGHDALDYFDPGLFPVEFGENPKDVFNMLD